MFVRKLISSDCIELILKSGMIEKLEYVTAERHRVGVSHGQTKNTLNPPVRSLGGLGLSESQGDDCGSRHRAGVTHGQNKNTPTVRSLGGPASRNRREITVTHGIEQA